MKDFKILIDGILDEQESGYIKNKSDVLHYALGYMHATFSQAKDSEYLKKIDEIEKLMVD